MENQTPAPIMMKFCTHMHPHLFKGGFAGGLTPSPYPLGLGDLKPYKLKDTVFTKQKVANLSGQHRVPQLALYKFM